MRLGISTASFFSRMMTEESLSFLGDNSVDCAEVFLDSYSEYTLDFASILGDIAKQKGIDIVSVHCLAQQFEPQLFSIGTRQRQDATKLFQMVLRLAKEIGAKKYVMHGPALLMGALKNANLSRIGPITKEIAQIAASYGVELCWENVSWCMYNYPGFCDDILEQCDCDELKFTFDVKQAIRSGYDPFEYIKRMGSRLSHVHFCDYSTKDGKLQALKMPGKGDFDFRLMCDMLKDIGYDGDIMIEVYSDLYGDNSQVIDCWRELKSQINT